MIVFSVSTYVKPKGAASAQNALSRTLGVRFIRGSAGPRQDRADALEVGKSPTEVPPGRRLPVAPPSRAAICEFASSSSPS